MKKKIISLIVLVMMMFTVIGSFPAPAFADTSSGGETITVYFTLSKDSEFVTGNDDESTLMAHVPVEIEYFDLAEYGLEDYYRYEAADAESGGGYINTEVVKKPTILHLYIKMIEKYYLGYEEGDGRQLEVGGEALSLTGASTSMYMTNFWGHDENLMYFVDHKYPVMREGWGATADYILLEDGMEIDVAMFTDWAFYHHGAFAAFSPTEQTVQTGEKFTLKMEGTATMQEADPVGMSDETIVYAHKEDTSGGYTNAYWSVYEDAVTDRDGNITMVFSEPGTYYVSSTPDYETFYGEEGLPCVAPPIAVINVEGEAEAEDQAGTENINVLSDLEFTSAATSDSVVYKMTPEFNPETTEYTVYVPDTEKGIAVWAEASDEAAATASKARITATYEATDGSQCVLEKAAGLALNLPKVLKAGEVGNDVNIKATCGLSSQEYKINIERVPSLTGLSLSDSSGNDVMLEPSFTPSVTEYIIVVPADTAALSMKSVPAGSGYDVTTNYGVGAEQEITLSGNAEKESFTVTVAGNRGLSSTYEITVKKKTWVSAVFENMIEGSVLHVTDQNGKDILKRKIAGETTVTAGSILEGKTYTYRITKLGYKGKTGSFIAGNEDVVVDGTLEAVEENESIDKNIVSQWPNFRGNDNNNAVTDVRIPNTSSNSVMQWAVKNGGGWSGSPSSPIIVGGDIVFSTNNELLKVDSVTGKVKQRGQMVTKSVFSLTPPTYADGMIFIALAGGRVQAFDATTLESLWVYQDELSGQPNSPLTYRDGYVYTGFWNNDDKDANFVCISAQDEDPSQTTEKKTATWSYKHKGGFYWAGAYAGEKAVIVGSENGSEEDNRETGVLYSFDPETGEVQDSIINIKGDIRSTVVYDETTDKYCFTGRAGAFYTVKLNDDGTFNKDSLTELQLKATGTEKGSAGSTSSTPVVYNGRAYVGVSGAASLGSYSGHNITVIDVEKNETAYTVETRGYPQASGLLTTAYEAEDGYNYIYFIENFTPGIVRVLKDKSGQTEPQLDPEENGGILGEANHNIYADTLFTPRDEQAEYCVASPIADEYGTIYFKNDSSYIMAVGSKITSLEIATEPDKLNYQEGETFDPAGMTVIAHMANGLERDVTEYVEYTTEPLTAGDLEIEISFNHVMYNDKAKSPDIPTAYVAIECIDGAQRTDAETVIALIEAIPEATETEEEWAAMKTAAETAREAFDALGYDVQKYVTNEDKLIEAETLIAERDLAAGEAGATVKVTKAAYNSLKIQWSKNENADGYEIYRSTSAASLGSRVKNVTDPDTVFFINDVTTGKKYYYTVRPYIKVDGKAAGSIYRKAVYGTATLSKPAGVAAKSSGYASVQLSWKNTAGANGYEIYRSTSKNSGYKMVKKITRGSTLSFKDTGLKTGTKYYYKIKAYRSTSYSAYSAVVNAVPKLAAVTGFKATAGKGKAVLTWKKTSGADGYVIYRSLKAKSGFGELKTVTKGSTVKYTNTGLKKGKTYYYKMRPYRKVNGKKVFGTYTGVKAVKIK